MVCTTAPAAHVGVRAVYEACRDELVELIGAPAYDVLATHCKARAASLAAATAAGTLAGLAPHPADPPP